MKKILIITTGGTIAMKEQSKATGAVPALTGTDLVELVPQIGEIASIDVMEFCNLPSPSITPEMMFKLSCLVNSETKNYDGFVITHGTDTLEETSYFLFLTIQTKKPVVFTAAMRLNKEIGLDGPRNLLNAVKIAGTDNTYDRGVVITINDEIFCARDVYKSSTNLTNAFSSPNYGVLGMVDVDKIIFYRKSEIRDFYNIKQPEYNVDLLKVYTGVSPKFIETSVNSNVKGLVIEAFGRGNVPPQIQDAIIKAIKAGIIVIITSRVPNGRVLGVYGYKGGAKQLEDAGAIMGSDLNSEKARLKLMVLLGAGKSYNEIKECFYSAVK